MAKRKKRQKIVKKPLWLVILLVCLSLTLSVIFEMNARNISLTPEHLLAYLKGEEIATEQPMSQPTIPATGEATFQFLNVGQGDATLIKGSDGTTILIDTGRYDDREKRIIGYLNEAIGTGGKIDLLIFTHGDSDHIGHGDLVLDYFDVKEVWMNGFDSTTKIYERLLDRISASKAVYKEPKRGETATFGEFQLEVLNPTEIPKSNTNDDSISVMLHFGTFSALFTGDASTRVEKELLTTQLPLQATLFQVGHHGSKDSNSLTFLQRVAPKIAVYSAGVNNTYGHPHIEAMNRIKEVGVTELYGTDQNGSITLTVKNDGSYTWQLEKGENLINTFNQKEK
ncbi:ComEC/Rec2 family competence protein [Isobaculum melis]|uniref:Metal-dependent hydrolase, beta-lactamase superfamily II n=1 Tax=Isobaculum melis TaxID=142588 RepID=A0A1H9T913_9LACT|nr:ComEC/Rec2 family competence protein [Isobaculum melis]SER93735.1 Metal-dependent hydrolase, beta-lactamase superfamily II [Isobaculum melis]